MRFFRWTVLAILAGAGCAHPPRPYLFHSDSKPADQMVTLLSTSLAHEGHPVAAVDRQKAELVTYWEDTRYRFRETDDLEDETNVFVRYHVQFGPADNQVSVTAEAQRCVPYRAVITRTEVLSTCIKMDRIFASQQRAVERLGQTLAATLGGAG